VNKIKEIRFIDLFRGIGGFHLGLERSNEAIYYKATPGKRNQEPRSDSSDINGESRTQRRSQSTDGGFRCVWSNDINKYATQIYKKHWPEIPEVTGDIRGINEKDIPKHDLICAGFPCQTFSVAGKRKGFEDTRGTLFFEICRIAEYHRPELLLLENVKGLLNHDGGRTFSTILYALEDLGYWWEYQVLNSKNFGVPQNRERVFIVGHLRTGSSTPIFPIPESNGLSIEESGERGGIASTLDANYYKGARRQRQFVMPVLTPDRPEKRQNGRRFKEPGEPMFTLTGQDKHGVSDGTRIRRLTPTECERLQGFPDGWTEGVSDTQRYKCLGNAVTVNVTEYLGRKIRGCLQ